MDNFKYKKGEVLQAGGTEIVILAVASPQLFWSKNIPRYKIKVKGYHPYWVWEDKIIDALNNAATRQYSRVLDESLAARRDFVLRYALSYKIRLRSAR